MPNQSNDSPYKFLCGVDYTAALLPAALGIASLWLSDATVLFSTIASAIIAASAATGLILQQRHKNQLPDATDNNELIALETLANGGREFQHFFIALNDVWQRQIDDVKTAGKQCY